MNEIVNAIIFVAGISSTEFRSIAQDFANLYSDRGNGVELVIRTHMEDSEAHLIELRNPREFYLFQFLVNYITYPKGRSYELRPRGYWSLNQGELPISGYEGQTVMLFIPETDTEYDNVYAVTEKGDSMILGFALGHEYTEIPRGRYAYQEVELNMNHYHAPQNIQSVPTYLRRAN